jgi:hypothetical protein
VIGDGGLLAAVDAYGNLVDLRVPGPAGEAQIANSFARQAAGTVPADTGMVPAVGVGRRPPRPLWNATRLRQGYIAGTNVLRTEASVGGAWVRIEDAAAGQRLARRMAVRGKPGRPISLRLGVNFDLAGDAADDAISSHGAAFKQLDESRAVRCRISPNPSVSGTAGGGAAQHLVWCGRGTLRAELNCAFAGTPQPAGRLTARAVVADRRWLERRRPLRDASPRARRAYRRSLLVLRALTDRRSGAVVAGARDHWAYIWPRDAGTAALALAASGYRQEARRVARFLRRLDLDAGARFRGDATAVEDGRALPGDSVGWARVAARAAGIGPPERSPGAWRDRGDYTERNGDRGDYLANAIAGGASAIEIRRLFATPEGLQRRAADAKSGLDSAAAWAVRPFPHPALFELLRSSLASIAATSGRYGMPPSEDWPGPREWTAPAAWTAWSLAALGRRADASRLIGTVFRASTDAGTIPERVGPAGGVPLSTTPLGWSHSFAILALHQLYGR